MDLEAIRDHLRQARTVLGPTHPQSRRIKQVERSLTPGDLLVRGDSVGAEQELLAIVTELQQLPEGTPTRVVNEAIKHVTEAIELL
jgi:hypothetical protein